MSISAAQTLWVIVALYCAVGLVFAVIFSWRGAARLDPRVTGSSWPFRIIILPAATALWPLLAWLWVRSRNGTRAGSRP